MKRFYIIKTPSGVYYEGGHGLAQSFTERTDCAFRFRLKWKAVKYAWEEFDYDVDCTVETFKVQE